MNRDNLAQGARPALIAAVVGGYLWYLAVTLSRVESVVFAAVAGLMIGASYAKGAAVASRRGAIFVGGLTLATMIGAQYFIDRHFGGGGGRDFALWMGFSNAFRMVRASLIGSFSEFLSWLAAVGLAVWASLRDGTRVRYRTR